MLARFLHIFFQNEIWVAFFSSLKLYASDSNRNWWAMTEADTETTKDRDEA